MMAIEDRWRTIEDVRREAIVCCRCDLCYPRTHVVFGSGPADADIMIVGEGPGKDEDEQAKPFVGRAGKLLDDILSRAGLDRENIWVTNIVRCRPTTKQDNALKNRAPRADEIRACELWMNAEFHFISPKAMVCLGAVPAQALIARGFRITEGRGRWHQGRFPAPITATFHPAYVLRLRGDDRRSIEAQMIEDFAMARSHIVGLKAA